MTDIDKQLSLSKAEESLVKSLSKCTISNGRMRKALLACQEAFDRLDYNGASALGFIIEGKPIKKWIEEALLEAE